MKNRMLAAVLALPLLAFDCGGKEEPLGFGADPFGLGCRLHVSGGGADESMWCIVSAYDYSAFPEPPASEMWGFIISGYRGMYQVGAGGGIYLDDRPTEGVTYEWSGDFASTLVAAGGFNRYDGSMQLTHVNSTLGNGSGEGAGSITFSAIPPANATNEQLIGVHGTLTATLPADSMGPTPGAAPVTITATF